MDAKKLRHSNPFKFCRETQGRIFTMRLILLGSPVFWSIHARPVVQALIPIQRLDNEAWDNSNTFPERAVEGMNRRKKVFSQREYDLEEDYKKTMAKLKVENKELVMVPLPKKDRIKDV